MLLYSIVLFVLLKGVSGPNEEKCKKGVAIVAAKCWICPEILLDLPFSESALESYCQHYLDFYKCIDNHRKEFSEKKLTHLALMLAKAESFIRRKLCKKTSIHRSYISHAPCLETVSQQFSIYLSLARTVVKKYEKMATKPNTLMAVSSDCLHTSVSLRCLGISISRTCGPDTNKLYIQIFEGTKFYSHWCPEFEYVFAAIRTAMIWVETGMDNNDRRCLALSPSMTDAPNND